METQTTGGEAGGAKPLRGVDVGALEKKLAATWRENAAGASAGEGESGMTRVCVANLIVYAPADEGGEQLDALLDVVAERMPTRAVVLIADPQSREPRLDAYVSSRCRLGLAGRKQVCSEEVRIEAGGAALETAASAVEPLLVPDIPTFLWWKDIPHNENRLFQRLVEMTDRVVIDSAAFDHPHEDMRRVSELLAGRADTLLISDINWGRLTTWRGLVAGFWDVPDYRMHLDALDSLIVEFEPSSSAPGEIPAQATLIVGWLASRLGWSPAEGGFTPGEGGARVRLREGGRDINLEFRAVAGGGGGALKSVTFKSAGGGAEFFASKGEGGAKLETSARVGEASQVGRVVAYEAKSEGQRLSRELNILARDLVYEESVAAAVRVVGA